MSRRRLPFGFYSLLFLTLLVTLSGCGRKPGPTVPSAGSGRPEAPPQAPAGPTREPTVSLKADPSTVRSGESFALSWSSTDAERLVIDNGVGTVAASGSLQLRPTQSTTYTATATNRLGSAAASTRVTLAAVEEPPPPPPPPARSDIDAETIAWRLQDVFFDYDKSDLKPEAQEILKQDVQYLRQIPSASFLLEGHCDERGTEEYNLALGDRRAQMVKNYLVSLGVAASRLETISYGEEHPFADGHDEATWSQNRRVHFTLRR